MSCDYLEESGLRLGFPAGHSFRFQDSKAYRALCGQALKEMDFAWYQGTRLYLLEIRDYRNLQMALELDDLVPRDRVAAPRRFSALVGTEKSLRPQPRRGASTAPFPWNLP